MGDADLEYRSKKSKRKKQKGTIFDVSLLCMFVYNVSIFTHGCMYLADYESTDHAHNLLNTERT